MRVVPGRPAASLPVLVVCLLLAGCGITVEKPELPKVLAAPPANPLALSPQDLTVLDQYVQAQRAAAQVATAEGRHQAAAGHWATVLALRPDDAEAATGRQAALAAAQLEAQQFFQRAQQAHGRGDLEGAQHLALEALARDPERMEAVQALRQWQRERNRGAGRVPAKAAAAPQPSRGAKPVGLSGEDWEYASLLAESGDIEGALQLLLPAASRPGADARLRARSCELLLDLARERVAFNDRTTALASVQRCLRLEPRHPDATRMLQQLKSGKR